jgi:site-specific recombinase XerD
VAGLELKDIDWRQSILTIRAGKTRRAGILPLTKRCGQAIADYLRHGRPAASRCARLFVRHTLPVGSGLCAEHVRGAMRRGYARAGLPSQWTRTHLLRHTCATRMHQRGATLKEIADILGHHCLDTTAIYTKVHLPALCGVTLPWPEVMP